MLVCCGEIPAFKRRGVIGGGRIASAIVALACLAIAAPSSRAADPAKTAATGSASSAKTATEMKQYKETIPGTTVTFEMVPIPGGEFLMGSPASEKERAPDEGPQRKVKIEPFWMGKYEVTWDEYDIWSYNLDIQRRKILKIQPTPLDGKADAVTRPTKPYTDMTFDMGHDGFPAISMTQLAAKTYCQWLSAKTGHYYRLPTEAEWEHAARAGTTTAYFFGDDPAKLGEYAWFDKNSNDKYQKIGKKKPNPWGLYDIYGNVGEWTLDQYDAKFLGTLPADKTTLWPYRVPDTREYPRSVRGGSWQEGPGKLRSASRLSSTPDWKQQDPQIPQSIWYLTDAQGVGFRLVRPLKGALPEEVRKKLRLDPERTRKDRD